MLLAHPWWLLGLAAAPVIWWLHRASGHGRPVTVASLLLFQNLPRRGGADAPAKQADPAWRRRALLACALALALADIAIPLRSREATLWLDDTLSMGTREPGGTRLQIAWRELRALQAAEKLDRLEIRSLTHPAQRYSLDAPPPAPNDEPAQPPPVSALRRDRAQWLLTDGSNASVNRWADSAALQRRILVGSVTANAAVTRLAARPSLSAPTQFMLEIEVHNAGPAMATRELILRMDAKILASRTLQLEAAASQRLLFTVPLAARAWSAQLQPADALPLDDGLELPSASLRPLNLRLDARCPAAVKAALNAHPGLHQAASDAAADLAVSCSATPQSVTLPTLVLPAPDAATARPTAAAWSRDARPALSSVSLPSLLLARGSLPTDDGAAQVMLQGTDGALALRSRAAPYRVVTSLDVGASAMSSQPDYALLLAQLVDLTLDRRWLSPMAAQSRSVEESRVAAFASATATATAGAPAAHRNLNLTALWLALAALALLWDLAAGWRERHGA